MDTLASTWDEFRAKFVPRHATDYQLRRDQLAFYGGAMAALRILNRAAATDPFTGNRIQRHMVDELAQYARCQVGTR